jgi:ATP-dependent DNA helicase RecQ
MGDTLGGRPKDPTFYDPGERRPNYKKMQTVPAYRQALDGLVALAQDQRIAVMCSEGDHRQCHRHLLITQSLLQRGVRVRHIQPDGSLVEGVREAEQLSLFG